MNLLTLKKVPKTYCRMLTYLGGLVGIILLLLVSANTAYHHNDSVHIKQLPQSIDAIVVLSGGKGRLQHAAQLWFTYWQLHTTNQIDTLPTLYFAGLGPGQNWKTVSKKILPGILQVLRPHNIHIENQSRNTTANAEWLMQYAIQQGWKKIILVTSNYHMQRSVYLFQKTAQRLQYPIHVETYSLKQFPFESGVWFYHWNGIRITIVEFIKKIYYVFYL